MKLVIQPIMIDRPEGEEEQYLKLKFPNLMAQILQNVFGFNDKATINRYISNLQPNLFDSSRGQFKSHRILSWLQLQLKPSETTKLLAICGFDAYFGNYNFCFGEAVIGGRVAAIYLERLLPLEYCVDDERCIALFEDRIIKESIHELGHTFGLLHCSLNSCIMFKSKTISDTDTKNREFCHSCFGSLASHLSQLQ